MTTKIVKNIENKIGVNFCSKFYKIYSFVVNYLTFKLHTKFYFNKNAFSSYVIQFYQYECNLKNLLFHKIILKLKERREKCIV